MDIRSISENIATSDHNLHKMFMEGVFDAPAINDSYLVSNNKFGILFDGIKWATDVTILGEVCIGSVTET